MAQETLVVPLMGVSAAALWVAPVGRSLLLQVTGAQEGTVLQI